MFLNLLAAVAINHANFLGVKRLRRCDYMLEQRFASQRLKHLRQFGTHPGALPGGEYDNTNIHGVYKFRTSENVRYFIP